jgi:HEPN domain-containing protein
MNRQQLQQLSELRLREAQALFAAGLPDGAYYLAGYAVECALKACIAKRTQEHDFPDKKLVNESHTHSLIELMRLSNLESQLRLATRSDPSLQNRWITVREWAEASRYQRWSVADAADLLEAIEISSEGILPWIRQHW